MLEKLKSYFKRPTPLEVIIQELTEAELSLLKSLSSRDYANAVVEYHNNRIVRLKKAVATFNRNEKAAL